MFNVKRNGASVEITDIPQSIPFSVFKNIADETGATETLICYFKDKSEYEVIIQHANENMAGNVAWLALEASKQESGAEEIENWYSKPKVLVVIGNDEIKINGEWLHDVLGSFSGISRTTDVMADFNYEPSSSRRAVTMTIKPILTETTLEEVLIRIGMIIGERHLDVIDDRTKSISS